MVTQRHKGLMRIGLKLGHLDTVCGANWADDSFRKITSEDLWALAVGELRRQFEELPEGITLQRRIIEEFFADFLNQVEFSSSRDFFEKMGQQLESLESEVERELLEPDRGWFQFGRALGRCRLGLPNLRLKKGTDPRDALLAARLVWVFEENGKVNLLAAQLQPPLKEPLKKLRVALDEFARSNDVSLFVPRNDRDQSGWKVVEDWIESLQVSPQMPLKTIYRSPPEWQRWLKENSRPASETSWGKFKGDHKGENHPRSGSKLVRFPIRNLTEGGLQIPPHWIDKSP